MGYFDALTSGYFKTAPDGRKLFFPWGVLGRGYTINSEPDYERLRRQVKAYTVVSLVLIVGVTALQAYVAARPQSAEAQVAAARAGLAAAHDQPQIIVAPWGLPSPRHE
jgi:hypothetical protein